jgi:hypothetical protein
LLVFLVFIAVGLALILLDSGLFFTSRISPAGYDALLWAAGFMFWAALLAELIGIALAFVRVVETRRAVLRVRK